MTFFFDNTFPRRLVEILKLLDVEATHLREHFPADTIDVTWIPWVGKKGWIIVTGDRGIAKKPAERKALEEAQTISLFLAKGIIHKPLFELVAFIVRHWPTIEKAVERAKTGTSLELTVNGRVEIL